MRILFDQGTPAPLRTYLKGHEVSTTAEIGWDRLKNGELLREAETRFDSFITTDQSIEYQQNLSKRALAIVVLPTTNWPLIRRNVDLVTAAVDALKPGDFTVLSFPPEKKPRS